MRRFFLMFVVFGFIAGCKKDVEPTEFDAIAKELPSIGKFMYQGASLDSVANWLGRPTPDGRALLEPINMVIVDHLSSSEEESRKKLIGVLTNAGFPQRPGHSSGYKGYINGQFFGQTPTTKDVAFADFMWAFTNSHARFFGPYKAEKMYVWIGSSSQEKGTIHDYVSFNYSRDVMTKNIAERTSATYLGDINLDNKINTPSQSTGDHDGRVKLIKLN